MYRFCQLVVGTQVLGLTLTHPKLTKAFVFEPSGEPCWKAPCTTTVGWFP